MKIGFCIEKIPICDCLQSYHVPLSDQLTYIAPRGHLKLPSKYKYHGRAQSQYLFCKGICGARDLYLSKPVI